MDKDLWKEHQQCLMVQLSGSHVIDDLLVRDRKDSRTRTHSFVCMRPSRSIGRRLRVIGAPSQEIRSSEQRSQWLPRVIKCFIPANDCV